MVNLPEPTPIATAPPPKVPSTQLKEEAKITPQQRTKKKVLLFVFALLLSLVLISTVIIALIQNPFLPPEEIRISNNTESSITISWMSNKSVRQKVYFSLKPISLPSLFLAKLFPNGIVATIDDFGSIRTTTHHATLRGLEPETQYYYVIANGFRFYTHDRQGNPLPLARTASLIESPPQPYLCYGSILDFAEEMPMSPVIAYLSASDSSLISAFTNSAGNYSFDLSSLRTQDLKGLFNLNQNSSLILEFQGGLWGINKQPLYVKNCQPIKTVTLE